MKIVICRSISGSLPGLTGRPRLLRIPVGAGVATRGSGLLTGGAGW